MTIAEIDWINFLYQNGLNVCKPVFSKQGNMVEIVLDGGLTRIVSVFEKAPGRHITNEEWNPKLFAKMGRMMGKMHALSMNYQPDPHAPKRFDWNHSIYLGIAYESIPEEQTKVWQSYDRLCNKLCSLSKNDKSFGLIHCDFHGYNFFIYEDDICLFDFDGCEYNWYVNDIAVSLFYAILFDIAPLRTEEKVKSFLPEFLNGYREENTLENSWLEQIPIFLRLREFLLYGLLYDEYRLGTIPNFLKPFMMNRREKIENEEPYFSFDILH